MRRVLCPVLVLAAVASGCGGGDDAPRDRLSLAPSTTTTTTPAVAALAERLPEEVGDGFSRADDIVGAGLLDLDDAAAAAPDPPEERRLLERHGFRFGVSRAWLAVGGASVHASLYEFADEAGAAAFAEAWVGRLLDLGAEPFAVEGGRGFTTMEAELTTHAVLVQRGTTWALVLAASEDGSLGSDAATRVAAQL